MDKRILVTGGAGFLGTHLCEMLLNDGNEVLCLDNYYTGRRSNVTHLLSNRKFEVIRHDICFPLYVEVVLYEVKNPGEENEERIVVTNPKEAGFLVTPNRLVIPPGSRKLVRFVNMKPLDKERIFRITCCRSWYW